MPSIGFRGLNNDRNCGSSSVDRALAFQAKGREFEPRLPLSGRFEGQPEDRKKGVELKSEIANKGGAE